MRDPEDLYVLEFMLLSAATIAAIIVGVDLVVRATELVIRRIWVRDVLESRSELQQRDGTESRVISEVVARPLAKPATLPISPRASTTSSRRSDEPLHRAKAA